jgi:hypothetical protein
MTVINLPDGTSIDFGEASAAEIGGAMEALQENQPELFVEPQISEDDYISSLSFDEAVKYGKRKYGESSANESDFSPTIVGQITDLSDRYEYGKADVPEEKEAFLTRTYGQESFGKDRAGRYFLNLDNIAPEVKAEKNLAASGTMWVNNPNGGFLGLFDMPDIADFVGANRGELLGATGAAFAATGLGLFPGALLIGAGAAVGKGLDELQEVAEGTQLQSRDEIYGDIANAAAWNAGGQFLVGGALKLLGKAVKGPGNPDARVISDLMDTGMTEGAAKTAAVQMQRTSTRKGLDEGLRPTIQEVTGKTVLGRLQAIHEGIFPNRTAARANRKVVDNLLKDYRSGELSEEALGAALDQNAIDVADAITKAMVDPDAAVKLANKHLRDVIAEEMKLLNKAYTPGDETATAFQDEMTRMVRLWQNNSDKLYENADNLLGGIKLFSAKSLREEAEKHIAVSDLPKLDSNPIYKYILGKADDYTIEELSILRTTLSNKHSGDLVGNVSDNQLGKLKSKIDEMFESAEAKIKERQIGLRKDNPTYDDIGEVPPSDVLGSQKIPENIVRQYKLLPPGGDLSLVPLAEGFDKFVKAQAHYAEGAQSFKTGALNMLNRNIKDGYFADLNSVVKTVVQDNKPELLKKYLKSVTPPSSVRGALQGVPETQWLEMSNAASSGNINGLNKLLRDNGLDGANLKKVGINLKPSQTLEKLAEGDPYRQRVLQDLSRTFELHAQDSAAAASLLSHKDINRQMLASTWMKTAQQKATELDVFDPVSFRVQFDNLGKEVQEELFGKVKSVELNKVLNDFALVADDKVERGLRFTTTAPNTINNSAMRDIVSNLQADVAVAQAQSTNAMFKAVKSGRIDDADSLIQAAVKDPKLLDDLIKAVPGDVLNQPFGIRDAAMSRIIRQAFPDDITEEAVINGSWQAGMRGAIANMNQRGSLNKILGRETVQDLIKLAKLPIGDKDLKGKGGLASSVYAAGIGLRILAEPVSGLASVAGVYLSGRIMRQKWFLKMLTRPNIRAKDLKEGIRGLTDDIMSKAKADGLTITREQATDSAKKQLGDLSVFRRRLSELAAMEARIITSTKASEITGPEQRRAVGETFSRAGEMGGQMGTTFAPAVQEFGKQIAPAQNEALRFIERNKLMGVGANQ